MSVLFLGGDMRQKYACDYLKENQIEAIACLDITIDDQLIQYINKSNTIIFPLPVTKDGVSINTIANDRVVSLMDTIKLIPNDKTIIGGKFSNKIKDYLKKKSYSYIDYYDDESFQIQNALISAEGAIYYAQSRFIGRIHNSKIAVLGFGRIAKILSYLLMSQGAKISIFARKDIDCTWSELVGFKANKIKNIASESILDFEEHNFDIIFNTIPHRIINESCAKSISNSTIIIDLASDPYGMDAELAQKLNLRYYRELSIPGRYAPKAAGEILGRTIINIINQEG